jgi:hypothetical protein
MTNLTYILKPGTSLTVLLSGKLHTINSSHANFNAAVEAVKSKDVKALQRAIDVVGTISRYTFGRVSVKDNEVYFDNMVTHNACAKKVLEYISLGLDSTPLLALLNRLLTKNPSKKSCDQFWEFVDRYQLPIDEEGFVYMTKVVKNDFFDKYTGKIDNHVGQVVKMPRNQVSDENTGNFCSHVGLHVGSLESYVLGYYGSGDDRVIVCKVAPENVCAVPVDHNFAKVRVCEYEVVNYLGTVEELKGKNEVVFTSNSIKTKVQVESEKVKPAANSNYHNVRDNKGKFAKKGLKKIKHADGGLFGNCYWLEIVDGLVYSVYTDGKRAIITHLTPSDCEFYIKAGVWIEF